MTGDLASTPYLSSTPHSVSRWCGLESTPLIGFGGTGSYVNQPLRDALASYRDLDQGFVVFQASMPIGSDTARFQCVYGDQDLWEEARLLRHATSVSGTSFMFDALEQALGILLITPSGGSPFVLEPLHRSPHWAQESGRTLSQPSALPQSRASLALKALADIQGWLTVSRDVVSDAAGLAKRTVAYWQSGETEPHASSTRRLLEVHGLVGSIVRAVGADRGRAWFLEEDGSGVTRLDVLRTEGGVVQLSRQARGLIFADPARVRHPSDLDLDDEGPSSQSFDAARTDEPPTRSRRLL